MEALRALTIERLKILKDEKKQLAFAYSACHRMFPNYQYFRRAHSWGDEFYLLTAMKTVSDFILTNVRQVDNRELLASILKVIPNSNDFENSFSTYAQNAGSAVYYTLNSLSNVNVEELSWSLVLSRDTVDAYVIEKESYSYDHNMEDKISNHPLMRRELQKQEFDFSLLRACKIVDGYTLESMTDFNDGKSNIDVVINK